MGWSKRTRKQIVHCSSGLSGSQGKKRISGRKGDGKGATCGATENKCKEEGDII
jgi:hypothetical protein